MSSRKTLIVVVGPTASGKTALAIRLAKEFGTEIISADSRQIYKGMAICTAQPAKEELAEVKHHLIASEPVDVQYSCARFEADALKLLEVIFSRSDFAVVAGGSGLYINALCKGMDPLPDADPRLRRSLTDLLEEKGLEELLGQLHDIDPDYYAVVDKSNTQRVLRALEISLQSGVKYSSLRTGTAKERPFSIVKIGIDIPREILYERINRRVDLMMEQGLEEEAKALFPDRHLNSLQTLGYRELFDFFEGKISRDMAIELIKRNTRHYAKRQMTWFRRDESIHWLSPDDFEGMKEIIIRRSL
jgi:tRNA dimethylallyltransferase